MVIKYIEPLTVRPDCFCLSPDTAIKILSILEELKQKERAPGFYQAFVTITNEALVHIKEFFPLESKEILTSQSPLIIRFKNHKTEPFLCEKLAYYQKKIASIRNKCLFGGDGKPSDVWGSFSEENLIGKLNPESLPEYFLKAAGQGDTQIIQTIINLNGFQDIISSLCFRQALEESLTNGHLKIAQLLISTGFFPEISPDVINFNRILVEASKNGYLEIVQLLINSGRFQDIVAIEVNVAFLFASANGHVEILKAFIQSGRFHEITSDCFKSAFVNASVNGHSEIIQLLIDLDRFQEIDASDLLIASFRALMNGHWNIVQLLAISKFKN
jgi:serine/threonine-protein phosphatase 6 regulatory ankyrin repeat subunit B